MPEAVIILFTALVWIIAIGVVVWALTLVLNAIPMEQTIKDIGKAVLIAVAVIVLLIYVLLPALNGAL